MTVTTLVFCIADGTQIIPGRAIWRQTIKRQLRRVHSIKYEYSNINNCWPNIDTTNNSFRVDGIDFTVTVGIYNIVTLAQEVEDLLNAQWPGEWTHTVNIVNYTVEFVSTVARTFDTTIANELTVPVLGFDANPTGTTFSTAADRTANLIKYKQLYLRVDSTSSTSISGNTGIPNNQVGANFVIPVMTNSTESSVYTSRTGFANTQSLHQPDNVLQELQFSIIGDLNDPEPIIIFNNNITVELSFHSK